eukprot:scaffold50842_cov309-Isochrysis_galbana.AAC.1
MPSLARGMRLSMEDTVGVVATVSASRAGPMASTIPKVTATLPAPAPASASTANHDGRLASKLPPVTETA